MKKILFILLLLPALFFGQATGYVIANKPSGGAMGIAATTVDVLTAFNLNQTTAGQTITIPNLTNASAGKIIYINNVGTVPVTLSPGGLLLTGTGVMFRWDGVRWNSLGGGVGGGLIAGTGVTISTNTISIGQSVATSDSPTFVGGTFTSTNVTVPNLSITDSSTHLPNMATVKQLFAAHSMTPPYYADSISTDSNFVFHIAGTTTYYDTSANSIGINCDQFGVGLLTGGRNLAFDSVNGLLSNATKLSISTEQGGNAMTGNNSGWSFISDNGFGVLVKDDIELTSKQGFFIQDSTIIDLFTEDFSAEAAILPDSIKLRVGSNYFTLGQNNAYLNIPSKGDNKVLTSFNDGHVEFADASFSCINNKAQQLCDTINLIAYKVFNYGLIDPTYGFSSMLYGDASEANLRYTSPFFGPNDYSKLRVGPNNGSIIVHNYSGGNPDIFLNAQTSTKDHKIYIDSSGIILTADSIIVSTIPPPGDSTNEIAPTAFVTKAIADAVSGIPAQTITLTGVVNGSGAASVVTTFSASTGTGAVVMATSPTLTNAVVGTQTAKDSTTKAASTAYVDYAVKTAVTAFPTAWSSTSTITIGAVTTPPTKATTVQNDFVRHRIKEPAIGSNTQLIEVDYMYSATSNAGTAAGSGNYLFTLPNSYQFNSTEHAFYTGATDLSDGSMSIYAIDRGKPQGMVYGDGFYDFVLIVPYDATRFRIIALGGNASDEWVGSGWYPITQATKVMSFKFTFYKQ